MLRVFTGFAATLVLLYQQMPKDTDVNVHMTTAA